LLLAGCDGADRGSNQPTQLDALVAFPPRDTIRFSLPATMHRCRDGRTLLIEAVVPEGSGVLVRLQSRDSVISGSYRIAAPGDTRPQSAVVVVRYLNRDVSRGFSFDSGTVVVTRDGSTVGGHIEGSGVENGIRTPTRIDYRHVPLPQQADTVPCNFVP
jgi:hypothetical protein